MFQVSRYMIKAKATQDFVPIKEIRDGVLIMKDNSYKMTLMASSLNFALKSEEEQEAIIYQFQSFLNSLDFSAQIFIESRNLNIEPYLALLKEAEKNQSNELLRIQTKEYIEFVRNFVGSTDIVTKTFYIVVSYSLTGGIQIKKGFLSNISASMPFKSKGKLKAQKEKTDRFEEHKIQLQQRADVVIQGLARCGIRVAPLNTEELIELFYKLFNPGELEKGAVKPMVHET